MPSDSFPFFQWIEQSLAAIFNTIYIGFLYIFGFLARICEILLLPFEAAAGRSVALLGWFFSDGFELVALRIFQTLGDFFYTLTGWGWDQFARALGLVLLWLDDLLPETFNLNLASVWLVVSYFRGVAWLIDAPFHPRHRRLRPHHRLDPPTRQDHLALHSHRWLILSPPRFLSFSGARTMSREFEFQCEGIYGLTGSGKTTFAMMRAFEYCLRGHRVYTNVDFSLAALRHHLLRREGFRWRDARGDIPRLHRLWTKIESDEVGEFWRVLRPGPAVVLIDEAQLWFPQTKQMHHENEDLVKYLSQHRKLRHHVWFVSQFPTLITHSFRKIQHVHWDVRNSRQMAMNLGFFTIRVPFEGFAYTGFYRDERGERIDGRMVLACLPSNRWIWDLFDSRELHAGLADLLAQGNLHAEVQTTEHQPQVRAVPLAT